MQYYHFVPTYFIHPTNPITIDLVGIGGTGSLLLTRLVQLNSSLLALGMKGISVRAWDPDKFSEANVGRQNVAPSDVGKHKAETLISRINRSYGFAWDFRNTVYKPNQRNDWDNEDHRNILVTCVDSGKARLTIAKQWFVQNSRFSRESHTIKSIAPNTKIYWLDLGNARYTGQVVLGSYGHITQPKPPRKKGKPRHENVTMLPTILDHYPNIDAYDIPDEPSCSVEESLRKQSLMMNAFMAGCGALVLTDMLMRYRLSSQGMYVNLENYTMNSIPLEPWKSQFDQTLSALFPGKPTLIAKANARLRQATVADLVVTV